MGAIEYLTSRRCLPGQLKAVLFDFDGTLSTLRCGWEEVMRDFMARSIAPGEITPEIQREVDEYIQESTGIQTSCQMLWLAERVMQAGNAADGRDLWWYKDEYNRRLMEKVSSRINDLAADPESRAEYLVRGSEAFLAALRTEGVELYLASGTDHADVLKEACALGLDGYFTLIQGAPSHWMSCSKEKVINLILEKKKLHPESLLVVGDGKVEIGLGVSCGAFTLGVASDETARRGVNSAKEGRLIKAGADMLTGDFAEVPALMRALGFPG